MLGKMEGVIIDGDTGELLEDGHLMLNPKHYGTYGAYQSAMK